MESGEGTAAIEALAGSGALVGAGTVMTIEEAKAAVDSGASFLVSPHFDPYLVEWAAEADVAHLPGILTPTEAASAMSMGVTTVKLFPAVPGGPVLVRALLGPFPRLRIVPTGGVTAENAADFIAAGAAAVGVGSWLTGQPDFGEVTRRARQIREAVA
jgi:2-dehydro-3-deoxyphosphogluconate aldolase/(4S)-4-hydroxy-2-oxoglutarate aldolase